MKIDKIPKTGWSKHFEMYNSNGFYHAHPEVHTQRVGIVYPEEMKYFAQWQADKTMFSAMPEVRWLGDLFANLTEPPKDVIDIACGVGRATVYLAKAFGWLNTHFIMYDSTGDKPTYGGLDTADDDTFYNDLDLTRKYLTVNRLENFTILDANELHISRYQETHLPAVDIAWSFMSFGFHFSFHEVLKHLDNVVRIGGLVIFGTRGFDAGSVRVAGNVVKRYWNDVAAIDRKKWKILRDARGPERLKCSVLVLERLK